ncbi:MAG: exodeoxyribonuclease I, partial [Pseudomonadota bacterium]
GFLDNADAASLAQIRRASPKELAKMRFDFHDQRLPELLFRYRARNWPETLTPAEMERWKQIRLQRLMQSDGGGSITFADFSAQITLLRDKNKENENALQILNALEAWGKNLFNP